MKIEELQPKIQQLIVDARAHTIHHIELVKKAFFKALDSLEGVVKATTQERPLLVVHLEEQCRKKNLQHT